MDWLSVLIRETFAHMAPGLQYAALAHAHFAPDGISARDLREIVAVRPAFLRGLEQGAQSGLGASGVLEIERGFQDLDRHRDTAFSGLIIGVVWGAGDDITAIIELTAYLHSGRIHEDFRAFATVLVDVVFCLRDQRYASVAEEAGRAVGSITAAQTVETFGSAPPRWLITFCGGNNPSVNALWRSICIGRLIAPLVLAVLTEGAAVASRGSAVLARSAARIAGLLRNSRFIGPARNWLTRRMRRPIPRGSGLLPFAGSSAGAAQMPIVTIRFTDALRIAPTDAQFLRFNIEWAQTAGPLVVGQRLDVDEAFRRAARRWMDANGQSRALRDAMHPLDSVANPFLDQNTMPGSTYYFGDRSVNRSFGSQLQHGIERLELTEDDFFLVRFEGFPAYQDVPPLAPLASPPNLRLRAR